MYQHNQRIYYWSMPTPKRLKSTTPHKMKLDSLRDKVSDITGKLHHDIETHDQDAGYAIVEEFSKKTTNRGKYCTIIIRRVSLDIWYILAIHKLV